MTSTELSLIRKFKGIVQRKTTNLDAVAVGGKYIFDIDNKSRKYDLVQVINLNTNNDTTLLINWTISMPLLAGNSQQMTLPIEQLEIFNDGDTEIPANQIIVLYGDSGHQGKSLLGKIGRGIGAFANFRIIGGLG